MKITRSKLVFWMTVCPEEYAESADGFIGQFRTIGHMLRALILWGLFVFILWALLGSS